MTIINHIKNNVSDPILIECLINAYNAIYESSNDTKYIKISGLQLNNCIKESGLTQLMNKCANLFNKYKDLYFKGGIARNALFSYVNNETYKGGFRDVDFVCINPNINQEELTADISNLFNEYDMDYQYSIDEYMKTRDIHPNEVLLRCDALIATRRAIKSIHNNLLKISPNEYVYPSYNDYDDEYYDQQPTYIRPRIAMRSLILSIRYNLDVNDTTAQQIVNGLSHAGGFNILVHLLKAIECNISEQFFNILKDHNDYVSKFDTIGELLIDLLNDYDEFNLNSRERAIAFEILKSEDMQHNSTKLASVLIKFPTIKKELESLYGDF